MRLSYSPLWRLMAERGITKKELIFRADISQRTVQKIAGNEPVTLQTILKICSFLQCGIEQVVEIIPDAPAAQ